MPIMKNDMNAFLNALCRLIVRKALSIFAFLIIILDISIINSQIGNCVLRIDFDVKIIFLCGWFLIIEKNIYKFINRLKMRQCQLSCKDRPSSFDFLSTTQANAQNQGLSVLVTHNTIQLYKHLDNSNNHYYNAHGEQCRDSDIVTSKEIILIIYNILLLCLFYLLFL